MFSRFIVVALLFAAVASAGTQDFRGANTQSSQQAVKQLQTWLLTPRNQRPPLAATAFATTPLTKQDAATARQMLWDDHAAFIKETRAAEMKDKTIQLGDLTMKFKTVLFGDQAKPPATGRSLFLSLHGGGGAPAPVNESQWHNQVSLAKAYAPKEGIYLAPRSPTNTWDLWHQGHIDNFFDRLIENLIVLENVNPNRVYVLGYSAGGDGVYQLAPRMADRWAAASVMAGHPNEASPLGLRNIGFALQVGANDSAYNRNKVAAEWGKRLDELEKTDPGSYAHFVELHAGTGHWMDLDDKKAIPWMEKFTRNPLPEKIVWYQDDVLHDRIYWLRIAKTEARAGQEVIAERKDQTITVTPKGEVPTLSVLLNDAMLDLDKPVTITSSGRTIFQGLLPRTIATIERTLTERGDPDLVFSAEANATSKTDARTFPAKSK